MLRLEVMLEDILHRLAQQLADDLVFLAIVFGQVQLDLAARAGGQRRQIADARRRRVFAEDQAAALGVGDHVLHVGDRHADADAGLLVDPDNIEEIAEAVIKILKDPSLKEALIRKGFVYVKEYDEYRVAQLNYEFFQKVFARK